MDRPVGRRDGAPNATITAAPAVHPANTATSVSNWIGAPRRRVNAVMITMVHPARRHRRRNPRGGRSNHGRQHCQAHRRGDPTGRDERVRLVDVRDPWRDVVDERTDEHRQQRRRRGGDRGDREQEPVAAHERSDRAAHDHHRGEDLPEQDHPGHQPRRQRLEASDQVGDEPDDRVVEERTDHHHDQQRTRRDREPQDVGRRPRCPARLGRDDLHLC